MILRYLLTWILPFRTELLEMQLIIMTRVDGWMNGVSSQNEVRDETRISAVKIFGSGSNPEGDEEEGSDDDIAKVEVGKLPSFCALIPAE